jgi:hypothetical protein
MRLFKTVTQNRPAVRELGIKCHMKTRKTMGKQVRKSFIEGKPTNQE